MNRIILIGNGFDLAHGLKTSYNDFIDWIVSEKFKSIVENPYKYSDDDISYSRSSHYPNISIEKIKEVFCRPESTFFIPLFAGDTSYQDNEGESYGSVNYKNNFLKLIIQLRYIKGWADIETLFYDELNKLLDNTKTTDKEIEKFNSDFQRIIDLLEEYLSEIENNNNVKKIEEITGQIYKSVISQDLSIEFKKNNLTRTTNIGEALFDGVMETVKVFSGESVSKILILDFNYTQTSKLYSKKYLLNNNIDIIKIHGDLYEKNNPIIFGFGDELDENYLKIEKSRLKGVLEYIKSINYLKTSNYREVLNFLELENYQVFIFGHSCGLTDRTLLNHIFEHNNCAGIKPFFYRKYNEETDSYSDNYLEIVSNIARNFTDKNKLRDRVVNYQFCEPLIK